MSDIFVSYNEISKKRGINFDCKLLLTIANLQNPNIFLKQTDIEVEPITYNETYCKGCIPSKMFTKNGKIQFKDGDRLFCTAPFARTYAPIASYVQVDPRSSSKQQLIKIICNTINIKERKTIYYLHEVVVGCFC